MSETAAVDFPFQRDVHREFLSALAAFDGTITGLAIRMTELGDNRNIEAIVRSIQRMQSGETRVSGEMLVIMTLLLQQQRRRKYQYANVEWQHRDEGPVGAVVDGFRITLRRQSRGRWSIDVKNLDGGYNPPWPAWQSSLEDAKKRAILCLVDGIHDIDELREQSEQEAQEGGAD